MTIFQFSWVRTFSRWGKGGKKRKEKNLHFYSYIQRQNLWHLLLLPTPVFHKLHLTYGKTLIQNSSFSCKPTETAKNKWGKKGYEKLPVQNMPGFDHCKSSPHVQVGDIPETLTYPGRQVKEILLRGGKFCISLKGSLSSAYSSRSGLGHEPGRERKKQHSTLATRRETHWGVTAQETE